MIGRRPSYSSGEGRDEGEIRQSIEHKDISGLLTARHGERVSDQNIAEMLNRNYELEPVNDHEQEQQQLLNDRHGSERKTVAYAITVTKDGPFVDGALVLGMFISHNVPTLPTCLQSLLSSFCFLSKNQAAWHPSNQLHRPCQQCMRLYHWLPNFNYRICRKKDS